MRRDLLEKSQSLFSKYRNELETNFQNRIFSDRANYFYELGEYGSAKESISQVVGATYQLPKAIITRLSESIDFALDRVANPVPVTFEALPSPLNEFEQQYFPSITFAENMIFTVRENNGRGDENLYQSSYVNDNWTKPEPISSNINTDRNEGTASISADGSTLVFTACNLPENIGSCDLYLSYKENGSWSSPELMSEAVNSKAWDSQPSLSRDGSKLYFVSRRPGGLGRQDIWMSTKSTEGWTNAVNLGSEVNTVYDDCSPYIYADNRTFFFASKGRIGLGGFDLFVAKYEGVTFGKPRNLGYPINNAFDQVGYSVSPKGWAYYSSSGESGRITLNRFKVPEEVVQIEPVNLISARILDSVSLAPVTATVSLARAQELIDVEILKVDKATGAFNLYEIDDDLVLNITAEGYIQRSFSVKTLALLPKKEVLLQPIKAGKVISFGTINFDFGSAEIKPESYVILDAVRAFILANPKVLIEIGGHTDSIGEGTDNMALSEDRARSVYQFLLKKDVPKENLVFKGYGEDHPLIDQNTKEGRIQNRRIAFKVLDWIE